ncbi:MAG: response regulator [Nitrospinae bacterium]|nr:response regulator [Nitrospinota bacterium]
MIDRGERSKAAVILLAEDNPADQELTRRAFAEYKLKNELHIVNDGAEAMDFLKKRGKYPANSTPRPDIILLDINMPKMDGIQALKEIKSDNSLKLIPVVMLTTSSHERDVVSSYNLGANAFITKPVDFNMFVQALWEVNEFWLVVVTLPPGKAP